MFCRKLCQKYGIDVHKSPVIPWFSTLYNWSIMKFSEGYGLLFNKEVLMIRNVHNDDVIMSAIVSQITSLTIVCSTVYPGADQNKHQSSASLAFVWGIHRGPVNSPHKWPVTWKMFPFDDVIMFNKIFGSFLTYRLRKFKLCLMTWAEPMVWMIFPWGEINRVGQMMITFLHFWRLGWR